MKGKSTKREECQRTLAAAFIVGVMGATAAEPVVAQDLQRVSADERIEFDIAAQPLSSALGASAGSDGLEDADNAMSRALQASANAQGQTSAEQATAQAIGVLSSQIAQLQALQAAQARAIATERLERIARDERSREIRRRAFPIDVEQPTQPVTPRF